MSPASSTRPAQASASATSATTTRACPPWRTPARPSPPPRPHPVRAHDRGAPRVRRARRWHARCRPARRDRRRVASRRRRRGHAGRPADRSPAEPRDAVLALTPEGVQRERDHVVLPDEHHDLDQLALVVARGELLPGRVADAAVVVELVKQHAAATASKASQPDASAPDRTRWISSSLSPGPPWR